MRAEPVLPFANFGYAFGNFLPADGCHLAGVESFELGNHRVPFRRDQPLLAAQGARIVVVRRRGPERSDMLHELVDGLLPGPRRKRAFAADTHLVRDRNSGHKLGNEPFGINSPPAPALHLARTVAGSIRLDIGTTDCPTSLGAM
jgi:hypothetical protein